MKNLEGFEDQKIDLNTTHVGGDHVCTSWVSADGCNSGDDLYDTNTCAVVYF